MWVLVISVARSDLKIIFFCLECTRIVKEALIAQSKTIRMHAKKEIFNFIMFRYKKCLITLCFYNADILWLKINSKQFVKSYEDVMFKFIKNTGTEWFSSSIFNSNWVLFSNVKIFCNRYFHFFNGYYFVKSPGWSIPSTKIAFFIYSLYIVVLPPFFDLT